MSQNRDYRTRDHLARAALAAHAELTAQLVATGMPRDAASRAAYHQVRQMKTSALLRRGRAMLRGETR